MAKQIEKHFAVADIVVFVGFFVLSSFIGIFFAYKDRKKVSTSNYYFAEQKMNPVAVGLSMSVSFLTAIVMIGIPAEVYLVGDVYAIAFPAVVLVVIIVAIYYIPVYCRLQLRTVYEYLELRFNPATRRLCSVIVSISMMIYLSSIVYLPAIAVNAVTPIPIVWSIVLTSAICTFYTALGGMKAVIWTDVLQAAIMIIALLAFFIRALVVIGGFDNLFASMERGQRFTAMKHDFDISSRSSAFAITLSVFFSFLHNLGLSQPMVQRFQSCRNKRHAQWALSIYTFPALFILLMGVANGCVMYAYFEGCDPVLSKTILKRDQGIPYMALQIFHDYPGMTGLFVASIFSGSLSTVSSAMNSLSVIFLEDFVAIKWPNLSQRAKLLIGKISVVFLGIVLLILSYIIYEMQSNIIKLIFSLQGLLNGPLMGIFLLGFFFPWANSAGAIIGALSSLVIMLWIFLGANFIGPAPSNVIMPPIPADKCHVTFSTSLFRINTTTPKNLINITSLLYNMNTATLDDSMTTGMYEMSTINSLILGNTTTQAAANERYTFDQYVYSLSFHYYTALATGLTVIFGLIISFITGPNKPSESDPKLFIPFVNNRFISAKVRKFFRFGVPELKSGQSDVKMENRLFI